MYTVFIGALSVVIAFANGQGFGPQPIFPPGGGNTRFPGPNVPRQPNPGNPFPGNNVVIQGDPFVYGTCAFNQSRYDGTRIEGRVDFRQPRQGGATQARVQVRGLPRSLMSDTERGIHVHEYGDLGRGCYAAGRHYDSDSFSFHGSPNNLGQGNAHEGDMGNLRQTNDGVIDADLSLIRMSLIGDNSVVGRATVLKEGQDDLGRGGNSMSLQTGNAGAPLACCIIAWSDATKWNTLLFPRSPNRFQGTSSTGNNFLPNNAFNPSMNGAGGFPRNGFQGNRDQGFGPINPQQGFGPGPNNPQQGFPFQGPFGQG